MSDREKTHVESPRAPISQRGHLVKVPADQRAMGAAVQITIDGQEVMVPIGTTILEAAKQIGMSRTALYRFLDGAPIHSNHFDAISAWIERQPQ